LLDPAHLLVLVTVDASNGLLIRSYTELLAAVCAFDQ